MNPSILSESKSALLVVDMQVDFCADDGFVADLGLNPTPCRKIVPELQELIDGARANDVSVLWAFADYDDARVPKTFLRRKQQKGITRSCCVPGTPGYQSFGVFPAAEESRFIKHSYSVFTNPDFENHLKSHEIATLVFSGVQTNVCVEATLRDAFNRGFNVVVAENCVASHTLDLHNSTLKNVQMLLGDVASSGDILECW